MQNDVKKMQKNMQKNMQKICRKESMKKMHILHTSANFADIVEVL